MATLQDIARLAGVSTATVSRTLSNPGLVAEATRAAVLAAVEQTGYQVNHAARNLRMQRAGSIIALVPNLANPFFSQILAGISSVLTPEGFGLLVADTQAGPDPDSRLRQYLRGGVADGLILFDGNLSLAALDVPDSPPVVAACEWLGDTLPSVRVENAHGAELAVRHLFDAGHRTIGYLTGPKGNVLNVTRQEGYLAALATLGLPSNQAWIYEGDFSLDSGAMAAARWIADPMRPGAMFCASDEMACGFMGAIQRAGLHVPRDVSVIGFDNIEVAAHMTPTLTTIRQPRTLIGERAANMLLKMIATKSINIETEIIPVELVERSSVANPAHASRALVTQN
ncbi:LacI family DNA-binding transcriptional regulator [Meridianimarinicoccus sp. RP-17]|uniref:LacI family DNA-binding transcriptional regulator n=1 Tax=Meridianimarinicoccus zhengii TaxID=2056810 RepID=UPI0013A6D51F|nr:LacI family DNA-binding transcriptional regulator [Phycocomes zhengii]